METHEAGIAVKVLNGHLPNTRTKFYPYTNLLGGTAYTWS